MSELAGKVVLVTGGTRGIGRACAVRFAADGACVVVCGRDGEKAREAAGEIGGNTQGMGCDVADPAAVNACVDAVTKELGPIYCLVNNAGITRDGLLMRMKDEHWDEVMRTNLHGAFHTCRAAARSMLKAREGRIINMSSVVGIHGQGGQANYSAAKAGLIGFTKAYAQEVAPRGITVNAVAPGYVPTDMTAELSEDQIAAILDRVPMKRAGAPEEIAGVVRFLASADAAYITGQVLVADGGLGM